MRTFKRNLFMFISARKIAPVTGPPRTDFEAVCSRARVDGMHDDLHPLLTGTPPKSVSDDMICYNFI